MAIGSGAIPDDRTLQRYLLGALADEDTERLDELSVVDVQFVLRLTAVEHDLVDSYANGELIGETLDRFKSHYLPVIARREKVEFAEALRAFEPARHEIAEADTVPRATATFFASPWLATAATVMLAAALALLFDDLRLRRDAAESRNVQAQFQTRQRQIEDQLNAQRLAADATAQELARLRESQSVGQARPPANSPGKPSSVLSFVLLPAMRDAATPVEIRVGRGTDTVTLRLRLEAHDFASYRAVLKDVTGGRVVWRSGALHTNGGNAARSLTITLGAKLLEPKAYEVDLTGVEAQGASETIAVYPFRVVIE